MRISGANVSRHYQHNLRYFDNIYFNDMVWGFCYLRIFKKVQSISGRSLPLDHENGSEIV
jgi:hypothetical protein